MHSTHSYFRKNVIHVGYSRAYSFTLGHFLYRRMSIRVDLPVGSEPIRQEFFNQNLLRSRILYVEPKPHHL